MPIAGAPGLSGDVGAMGPRGGSSGHIPSEASAGVRCLSSAPPLPASWGPRHVGVPHP